MKKYLPIFIFIMFFSAMLSIQVFVDMFDTTATVPTVNSKMEEYFNSLYKKKKFKDIEGKEVVLSSLKSKKVVVNFWASWCGPCLGEIKELRDLYGKISRDKLEIISINVDEVKKIKEVKKLKEKFGIDYTVIADPDGKISNEFHVSKLPYNLIFEDGKMSSIVTGISSDGDKILSKELID